ncbi:hypothetical protein [Pseudomonas eucalypticola]|uniref:Uncharacterized protein n=1 Tax=Pseudomonas eucalypticola TaxID=2599595 RepID=A0A7D5D761_9PSED|nr:hypothetical protein [Pseudomonas eucalypticola]QKZ04580.1 hypothetical protein HWQ56_12620 [Pseudomonas eucalypticola]
MRGGATISFWRVCAALIILFCAVAQGATGPELAQVLNSRYASSLQACAVTLPAFNCVGVLVKPLALDHDTPFWAHDAVATSVGSEGFAYLRAGPRTVPLAGPIGFVLSDGFEAIAAGKPYEVLCAYPIDPVVAIGRADYGCAPQATAATLQDYSSCAALGVLDAADWLRHFHEQDNQPSRQCSFSAQAAQPFMASIGANQALQPPATSAPVMRIRNWDAAMPAQLAVSAVFYDITATGALSGAQRDQLAWFQATGEWLPVLRFQRDEPNGRVFGFELGDQLYRGYGIAAALNARYQALESTCQDARPAFYCNGVLVRAAEASTSFHAWNPSPNSVSRNGVSFTYLRADSRVAKLAGTAGFVFRESAAPVAFPVTLRCAYPANAGTSGIPDSCRAFCDSAGITTGEAWRARYAGNPGSSCAFRPAIDAFALSLQVRAFFSSTDWNEIIIGAWPQDIPTQLPLEAFFYSGAGLNNARFMQRDYTTVTGRHLPLVALDLAAPGGQVFSYAPADQVVRGTLLQSPVPRARREK